MSNDKSFFWELFRKTVHLSGLSIVVGYTLLLNYFSERIAILVITALLLLLLEIEYFRIEHKPRIAAMFDGLWRKHEHDNLSGAVYLVISCIICFAAFEYWVAFLALFMTGFGDLFAAIFGKAFGKTILHGTKTFVGTFAGFAANVLVGFLILPEYFILFIPMALTASFVEFVTNKLDDNLTVPIFAGFAGQMLVYYFAIELPPIDFTFLGLF